MKITSFKYRNVDNQRRHSVLDLSYEDTADDCTAALAGATQWLASGVKKTCNISEIYNNSNVTS